MSKPVRNYLGAYLSLLDAEGADEARRIIRRLNVKSMVRLISILQAHPDEMTVRDLKEATKPMSNATLYRRLVDLEDMNLVRTRTFRFKEGGRRETSYRLGEED